MLAATPGVMIPRIDSDNTAMNLALVGETCSALEQNNSVPLYDSFAPCV